MPLRAPPIPPLRTSQRPPTRPTRKHHPLHTAPMPTPSILRHCSTASPSPLRQSHYARGMHQDPSLVTLLSDQPPSTHCRRRHHHRRRLPPLRPRRSRVMQKCVRVTTKMRMRWIGHRPHRLSGLSSPHVALCPRRRQRARSRVWRHCWSVRILSTHQNQAGSLLGPGEGEG